VSPAKRKLAVGNRQNAKRKKYLIGEIIYMNLCKVI